MSGPAVIAVAGLTLTRQAIASAGGHQIELCVGELTAARLESIEGAFTESTSGAQATSEKWPASPPVQEWHDEPRGDVTVLMAVGRAGRSHWSLSCEVTAAGRATFDIAVRLNEPPERLGSSYRATPADVQSSAPDQLQFAGGWRLVVDRATAQLRYDNATGAIFIEPAAAPAAAWPQTIRWRYWFERASGD